jgi:hypothetical protein
MATVAKPKIYCEDCARKHELPTGADLPRCYYFCSMCGVKRACYGVDPEPPAPRVKRLRLPADHYPLR